MQREDRIVRFAAGETTHRLRQFDFFKKIQEDLDAAEACSIL